MTKKLKGKGTQKTSSRTSRTKRTTKTRGTTSSKSVALATISYDDIVQTELFENKKDGRAMHLMKSAFNQGVLDFINSPTPRKYVLKREGPGKKMFDYIPGWYAKKCANYAFGFNYSFEIKSKEIVGVNAVVEGRFIVYNPKTGKELFHKDDIGGHEIRFVKNTEKTPMNAVSIANDYKSAVTDCMKRCMAQIGFWKDVYGANEVKEAGFEVTNEPVINVEQPATVVEAKAVPVKPIEVDHVKRLDEHLAEKGAKTEAQKEEYIKKVLGPANKERYKLLSKKGLTSQQAQQILGAVLKAEAEGR